MKLNSIDPQKNVDASSVNQEPGKGVNRTPIESVLEVIHAEHEIIKSLMVELESEHRPSVRTDLFRRLQVKLLCHVHAENSVIFCHLSRYEDAVDFVSEHQLGHQEIAAAADTINSLDGGAKSWNQLFSKFVGLVESHIVGTEDSLFALVNSYFSDKHRETLASQYRWAAYRHYREIQGSDSPALHRV